MLFFSICDYLFFYYFIFNMLTILFYVFFIINLISLLFFTINYHFVRIFIVFFYLGFIWLFFIFMYSFSFVYLDFVFHLGFNIYISLSLDSFSFIFIFLSLVIFSSWYFYLNYFNLISYNSPSVVVNFFYLMHVSFCILFIGNIGFFVIFLEFLSIPVFILFLSVRSSDWLIGVSYLFFYSILTGLFILISISTLLFSDFFWVFSISNYYYLFFIFVSLLIKSAFWPFHSWLPYVHSLSSTSGSVFLAGIFLKLGSYGIIRLYYILCLSHLFVYYQFIFIFLSLLGIFSSLFGSIVQVDFKKFIAFSSVFHMNFTILILFTGGIYASILVWLSHGFVTSLLFYLFGYVYFSFSSRLSYFYGNLIHIRLWYFLFILTLLIDLGLPPFLSFFSEVISFYYLWFWSYFIFFIISVSYLFSCYVTLNSILRFSIGFSSFISYDLTLPLFYLYFSFISFYLFISFNFTSFDISFLC